MVRGLALFREHFRDFRDRYVLIGGTACDLVMADAGLPFRATKDLDIVLCLEVLDSAFARAFWRFVADGEYEFQETKRVRNASTAFGSRVAGTIPPCSSCSLGYPTCSPSRREAI